MMALKRPGWETVLRKHLNAVVDDAAKVGALGGSRFALAMAESALSSLKVATLEIHSDFIQCLTASDVAITDETIPKLHSIICAQVIDITVIARNLLIQHASIRPNPAFGDHGQREALAGKTFDSEGLRLTRISEAEMMRELNKLKRSAAANAKAERSEETAVDGEVGRHSLVSPESSQSLALAGFGIAGALATGMNPFLYYVGFLCAALSVGLIIWVNRHAIFRGKSQTAWVFPSLLIGFVLLFTGGMVFQFKKNIAENTTELPLNAAAPQTVRSTLASPAPVMGTSRVPRNRSAKVDDVAIDEKSALTSVDRTLDQPASGVAALSTNAISVTSSSTAASAAALRYSVRIECLQAKLPATVPPGQEVTYVGLTTTKDRLDFSQYMTAYPDRPGSKIRNTEKIWGPTFACTVTNTGDVTLYDVFFTATVIVNNIVRNQNVFSQGDQLSKTTELMHIDKLENAASKPFKFYVFSKSDHIYDVQFSNSLTGRRAETENTVKVDIKGDRTDRHVSIWPVN